MRKFLIILFTPLVILFLAFAIFFMIAKSPNWNFEADYNKIINTEGNYSSQDDTVHVVTYNIGYLSGMTNNLAQERPKSLFENNLNNSISLFQNMNADIIGLQEVDFDADRSLNVNQLNEIGSSLNYPSIYQSVNWDKVYLPFPYWPPSQHFGKVISGQGILSKFKIESSETIKLERPKNVSFLYEAFYIDRLVQIVDLQIGTKIVKVMNLHLEAFDEESRMKQAHVVKQLYESFASKMPVILIGDFNSTPVQERAHNSAMEIIMSAQNIESSVSSEAYESNKSKFYTYSSGAPTIMIDYILYNSNFIDCFESEIIHEAEEISDHLPVSSKLIIKQ